MSANLLEIYGSVGGFAKNAVEQASATSAHLAEVIKDGCRVLADGAAFQANHATQTLDAVSKCRSPEDLVAAQRAWLEGSMQRMADDAKTYIDLTGKLLSGVAVIKPAAVVEAAPVVVSAPVVVAAPVSIIEEAPVAVVEAAPVVEEAPVAVVEATPVVEEAPVAVVEATLVVEEAPIAVVEAAPVVQAPVVQPPSAPKGPSRSARRGKGDRSAFVAAE